MTYFIHRTCCAWLFFILFFTACKKETPVQEKVADPRITSFRFTKEKNSALFFDIDGVIEGDTIFVRYFAGFDPRQLVPEFLTEEAEQVRVSGNAQHSGESLVDFTRPVTYEAISGNNRSSFIVKFTDLGVPAIYISTNGTPILNKEDYVDGTYKIYSGTPGRILHEGALKIRGRGNSTWEMPKKPYRLKLDKKTPLLEMPENKNWALMANYADRSLIRNEVGFEVSRRMGLAYTPRQRFVDFFLNGAYQGSYNIAEHQEEGNNKINIDEDNGGYYLEVDGYAQSEPVYFITGKGVPVTIKFPGDDDISGMQKQYIEDYYAAFENALFSNNFRDPATGYRKYLDMPSFINYYLANEVSGNPDMLWSMKMYKKSSGDPKLYTGPVWDFDLAVNNDNRLGDASQKLMMDEAHYIRQWMDRLKQDGTFRQEVRQRWNVIKASLNTIPAYADSVAQALQYSQKPNFMRWNILSEPNIHLSWYTGKTYEDYVLFLSEYFKNRILWLDQVFNSAAFVQD